MQPLISPGLSSLGLLWETLTTPKGSPRNIVKGDCWSLMTGTMAAVRTEGDDSMGLPVESSIGLGHTLYLVMLATSRPGS